MEVFTRDLGIFFVVLVLLTLFWRRMNSRLGTPAPRSGAVARTTGFAASIDRRHEPALPIDLRQLLFEMPQDCFSLLQGGRISLMQSAPRGALSVDARREELRQLLAHVAAIACLAMPRGGVLNMLAMAEDGEALIEFMDVGIGGKEPLLAALFLHGSQAAQPAALAEDGLAAGVASCRRIVDGHGGRIDAAPSVWGGLGLTIRLPLLAKAAAAA